MPLFWALSSICFWMLKVKFRKAPTKKQLIAARRRQEAEALLLEAIAHEKRVAIKQSKLSFDPCSVNFFGIVLRSGYPTLFVRCVLNEPSKTELHGRGCCPGIHLQTLSRKLETEHQSQTRMEACHVCKYISTC